MSFLCGAPLLSRDLWIKTIRDLPSLTQIAKVQWWGKEEVTTLNTPFLKREKLQAHSLWSVAIVRSKQTHVQGQGMFPD